MSLLEPLLSLPRATKQRIALAYDLIVGTLVVAFAITINNGANTTLADAIGSALLATVMAIAVMWTTAFYQAVTRFVSTTALNSVILGASAVGGVVFFTLPGTKLTHHFATSLLAAALFALCIGGTRLCLRNLIARFRQPNHMRQAVIIYGAGAAGMQTAAALRLGQECMPIAFVDDDATKHYTKVDGLTVYPPKQLPDLVKRLQASMLLLAIPSASLNRRKEVLALAETLRIEVKTIPGMADIITGKARIEEIRDVSIEDLLGREPVAPIPTLLKKNIASKHVLVTGAGGSIGSELARQIAQLKPNVLVLLEISEFALYQIDKEIKSLNIEGLRIVPILGSVTNRHLVEKVISRFNITTIYHAAAYKHVPLVEHNILSGVRNNVFGTLEVAEAAGQQGVESVILISTDKAVRPTNVMGATKRMAELILQALNTIYENTTFSMVRFGNVLGSSGSVVPLFKEQIAKGGPVTVTHPQVIRYFMTIPEAASLVIQAGAMAKGGDVFLLDMGEPVRIVDLARRMIRLSGLTVKDESNPNGDIAITFTGLRPGEKLYEELLIAAHRSEPTDHPRILRAMEERLLWEKVRTILGELKQAIEEGNPEKARAVLLDAPLEFSPTSECVDHLSISEESVNIIQMHDKA